jgi:hypothetical protein
MKENYQQTVSNKMKVFLHVTAVNVSITVDAKQWEVECFLTETLQFITF